MTVGITLGHGLAHIEEVVHGPSKIAPLVGGHLCAGLLNLPMIPVFFMAQCFFIQGIAVSGIKG